MLILDLVGKAGFFRLVSGLDGDAYTDTIDFSVTVHRLAFALTDVRNALTAAFVLAAVTEMVLRRVQK